MRKAGLSPSTPLSPSLHPLHPPSLPPPPQTDTLGVIVDFSRLFPRSTSLFGVGPGGGGVSKLYIELLTEPRPCGCHGSRAGNSPRDISSTGRASPAQSSLGELGARPISICKPGGRGSPGRGSWQVGGQDAGGQPAAPPGPGLGAGAVCHLQCGPSQAARACPPGGLWEQSQAGSWAPLKPAPTGVQRVVPLRPVRRAPPAPPDWVRPMAPPRGHL